MHMESLSLASIFAGRVEVDWIRVGALSIDLGGLDWDCKAIQDGKECKGSLPFDSLHSSLQAVTDHIDHTLLEIVDNFISEQRSPSASLLKPIGASHSLLFMRSRRLVFCPRSEVLRAFAFFRGPSFCYLLLS